MRLIIFLIVFLLFEWYIFKALKVLMAGYKAAWRQGLSLLYWTIGIGFMLFLLYVRTKGEAVVQNSFLIYIQSLFMIYFLSKILLACVLFIDDLRWLIAGSTSQLKEAGRQRPGRSAFLVRLGLILAALPFTTLIYGQIRNAFRYKIFRQKVHLPDLPKSLEGFRIVQISDIHSGSFMLKTPLMRAVEMINAQKADLVVFTGDLVNETAAEMDQFMDVLDKIRSRHGVFSIFGNHDYGDYAHWADEKEKGANLERMKEIHRLLGWKLLLNSNHLLKVGGDLLAIIGVENYSVYDRFPTYGNLAQAYQGTEEARFKLLLSHDPSHWEDEVTRTFKDIQLTLSGHTHGSQFGVEIPGRIKWSPVKYLYKQWAGLYQKEGQYLYVNRGLGFIGYAGRVGILPEITVMELSGKK